MPAMSRYELLSIGEAAAIIGVHKRTVYRMVDDGRLRVAATIGSVVAFERDDVETVALAYRAMAGIRERRVTA